MGENADKARHGANARETLHRAIDYLLSVGAVIKSSQNPKYGYDGYDPKQFSAHEEVTLANGRRVVLYATTTVRSDRIGSVQWRVSNIKSIDPGISEAYVVVPDEEGFKGGGETMSQIRDKRYFSALDDVMTIDGFCSYALEAQRRVGAIGVIDDLHGRAFEEMLADILESDSNLSRYNGSSLDTGYFYDVFKLVMECIGVGPGDVEKIRTSTQIGRLPSGGNPKTDLKMVVVEHSGCERLVTFSIKNSSAKAVSVHEYSAEAFSQVLDPTDLELRRLLESFQSAGNYRDMPEADRAALTEKLKPYLPRLNSWVFSGAGAAGVKSDQIAQYIVVRDRSTGNVGAWTIEGYVKALEENVGPSGGFGTLFGWTYPSHGKHKRIQLKSKVLHP